MLVLEQSRERDVRALLHSNLGPWVMILSLRLYRLGVKEKKGKEEKI